jgi:radical S-adenosyl methionine domain-containing protein 2
VFQVLPVEGQNDGAVDDLLISSTEFEAFVTRHHHLREKGIELAVETNEDMTGSYAMIDPLGRFFSNVSSRYVYSDPILKVGVNTAFSQIAFSERKFLDRGGSYAWRPVEITVAQQPVGGPTSGY